MPYAFHEVLLSRWGPYVLRNVLFHLAYCLPRARAQIVYTHPRVSRSALHRFLFLPISTRSCLCLPSSINQTRRQLRDPPCLLHIIPSSCPFNDSIPFDELKISSGVRHSTLFYVLFRQVNTFCSWAFFDVGRSFFFFVENTETLFIGRVGSW